MSNIKTTYFAICIKLLGYNPFMKINWKTFNINGKSVKVMATDYEPNDKALLKRLYFSWRDLNNEFKKISTRGINLPEQISENAFCLFFENCVRVVKLQKGKCSYDVLNIQNGSRIQIKASSIEEDLTSFGPRSEWDELYFLDFSRSDGTFDVYKVNPELVYKHQMNQKQSFKDQQDEGKRPRFSIKKVMAENGIGPVKVCSLN